VYAIALPLQSDAQEHLQENVPTRTQTEGAVGVTGSESVHILYTGKLLGYFRDPDGQRRDPGSGPCRDGEDKEPSKAAMEFAHLLEEHRIHGVILVGMGDNFAPEVEAREFCSVQSNQSSSGTFERLGKEFFVSDGKTWLSNDKHLPKDFLDRLAAGKGFLPDDNVAKFFVHQGFAAIVPGKHDFYYGAERLRELAWLLASAENQNAATIHSDGVQMLASNLVIETTWKTGHESLSDRKEPPWFIPRFPTATDLVGRADIEIRLSGITDGGSVYPWFQGPSFSFSKLDQALEMKVKLLKFFLCKATHESDPDSIADPNVVSNLSKPDCTLLATPVKNAQGQYPLRFPWGNAKSSTLLPGKSYGFCVDAPMADPRLKDKKGGHRFCVRFSTYVPLLQYPAPETDPCLDLVGLRCRVPQPFVLLEKRAGLAKDVAIFGAVDPHLPDYVGLLNLSWENTNGDYKTQAAVKDPAEALKQMDGYFEQKYRDEHDGRGFDGIKILLAQMSPQEAEVLAMRVGNYQVVVSAAEAERVAYDHATNMEWQEEPVKDKVTVVGGHPAKFLAVPEPFYDEKRKERDGSAWVVDIGSLTIHSPGEEGGSWHLKESHLGKAVDYGSGDVSNFWNAVQRRVAENCLPQNVVWTTSKVEQIQWLTVCAMQENAEADIALLQKRDFFATLPGDAHDLRNDVDKEADPELQHIVDRIIWKGDFLIVSHVPGSVIQKVMAQSKTFDADDKSQLSLSDERNRGLVYAGIHYDDERGEYLVNGVPLDPNKLYSVVTSDFVTGGDTGYMDLGGAQANPPITPKDLDGKLWKISSVVCRKLAGSNYAADCLDSIERAWYFDDIALAPRNTQKVNTPTEQLESWSLFHNPGAVPGDPSRLKPPLTQSARDAADKTVEHRPLWDFALTKWTLGITALGHNRSDFDVQNDFGGVSAPSVNAVRSSTWASEMQAQYMRNWLHNQILVAPAYTFNTQYKGQPDDFRQINQQADLGMFDLAAVHLWNGRGQQHFDSIFTGHFETPLARIFNAFSLSTTHLGAHGEPLKDQLRFAQDRSYTQLLRPGIRWMRRKSSAEIGPEWGHEWNALEGFTFLTNGTATTCLATAAVSISQCVKNAAKANPQSITPASQVDSLRSGHNHAGMYWKFGLTVPFHPKVSYVFTDTGDWFFVHYHTDNSTDARFRDVEQHQLKLTLFPSLSIGPEVDLLFYENASAGQLAGHFLRQDQVMMKAQFSFDLFNGRKIWQQIKYAPPATQK